VRIGNSGGLDFVSSLYNRTNSTASLQKDIEKLSTGKRINRAADDSAGLSINQKLESKIRGNNQAKKNIGDAISMLQTIDGSLSIVLDDLQRIRELKVQSLNGTNSTEELNAMQREINTLVDNMEDIGQNTTFNGRQLIWQNNQNTFNIRIQTGSDNGDTDILRLRAGVNAAPTGTGVEINVRDGNANARGELGEGLNRFRYERIHLDGATVNSRFSTRTNNRTNRNTSFTLDQMDTIIGNVTRMRTFIGSEQNRFEAKLNYLDVAVENQMAAQQRVEDTDIAEVTSSFTKHQIKQQSSALILSQARNIQKDMVLSLLP
jgi:flagellin